MEAGGGDDNNTNPGGGGEHTHDGGPAGESGGVGDTTPGRLAGGGGEQVEKQGGLTCSCSLLEGADAGRAAEQNARAHTSNRASARGGRAAPSAASRRCGCGHRRGWGKNSSHSGREGGGGGTRGGGMDGQMKTHSGKARAGRGRARSKASWRSGGSRRVGWSKFGRAMENDGGGKKGTQTSTHNAHPRGARA